MNIGITAQNSKKSLMDDFCIAYKGILAKHDVYATYATGKHVEDVTNLRIHKFLPGEIEAEGGLVFKKGQGPSRDGHVVEGYDVGHKGAGDQEQSFLLPAQGYLPFSGVLFGHHRIPSSFKPVK